MLNAKAIPVPESTMDKMVSPALFKSLGQSCICFQERVIELEVENKLNYFTSSDPRHDISIICLDA